ncbi:hypothetical protein FACS189476_06680 [Spirochaetia bacterium]|nr:hypothetical protein FACS189476_06680 [Spirochaetia bacterium]
MILFYLLSLASGFFEVGPVVMILSGNGDITSAIIVVLCYQAGNLVPCPITLSRRMTLITAVFSAISFSLYAVFQMDPAGLPLLMVSVLFASAGIQSARSVMKTNAPKLLKRGMRVTGFGLGFLCFPALAAAGALIITLTVLLISLLPDYRERFALPKRCGFLVPSLGVLNWTMVFHQMHYFVYCYAVLITAYLTGGKTTALVIFLLGWIVYVISPRLYSSFTDYRKIFLIGHSLLAIILIGIYFVPSVSFKAAFWVLTGIGGTTEFCIGKLSHRDWDIYRSERSTFSENLGHVLGVLTCLIIYIASGSLLNTVLFAAGFILIAITLISAERMAK